MKVAVTGGTGFVGSHTIAQVTKAGHEVKLLVRDPRKISAALNPLGIHNIECTVGSVTNIKSVEEVLEGCDALIHCASVYSLDPRFGDIIRKTNASGTKLVLDAAHRRKMDPIVHVSSFVALIGEKGKVLNPASLPSHPKTVYPQSKADSDRIARAYQKNGAPVVITYPGAIWGPHDPHIGESSMMIKHLLRGFWTLIPDAKIPNSDVRDVAQLHAALLEKGQGPRRFMSPSQNASLKEMGAAISRVTGRRLLFIELPSKAFTWPLQFLDLIQRIVPIRFPSNFQAVYIGSLNHSIDDSLTRERFGMESIPFEQSVSDAIRWMHQHGHISSRLAGKLATSS